VLKAAMCVLLFLYCSATSFAQWGGSGNKYEVVAIPMEEDEPMYQQNIEGENNLELLSTTWVAGKGTMGGIDWQSKGAKVEAKINDRKFVLTGENGGLDIKDNIVFLIFKDIRIPLDEITLKAKDTKFFSDSLGLRLKRMQEKGIVLPVSEFSVKKDTNKSYAEGILVIALDIFTSNGQYNSSYSAKAFIRKLANWKIVETKN
jgi:hypothetical protein